MFYNMFIEHYIGHVYFVVLELFNFFRIGT